MGKIILSKRAKAGIRFMTKMPRDFRRRLYRDLAAEEGIRSWGHYRELERKCLTTGR